LPVNVRILVEGEEEIGGESVVEWVRDDSEGVDCAVVFDAGMLNETTPSITLGVRGHIGFDISIRTAESNLHSGLYGGSVVNAAHVMHRILAEVMPGPDGRLREELRVGIVPPTQAELDSWAMLPPGDDVLAEVGAMPLTPRSGAEYYVRNWADASLDIAGVSGGDAFQIRTIVPSTATATFNMRLAPGQRTAEILPVLKRLVMDAVPPGVEITDIKTRRGEAALFSATEPAIVLAAEALHEATGVKPAFVRSGGSIPILAAFADRGIPTILSGFGLPQDRIHAPDESFRVKSLELAERSARALYSSLSRLEVGTR
ncbi:MAG TPA: M20/M25/M40 family metallo-hydrolase, partial [Actinomycetota bacterium]|nr:M20/M25/M40 family metallo-hydrolase [Actinomycetota bacterium]